MRFLDILEAADFDEARFDQAALDEPFEDEAIPAASDAVDDWTDANCSTQRVEQVSRPLGTFVNTGAPWRDLT